jgi:selenocysteine-specific translation elongation factor
MQSRKTCFFQCKAGKRVSFNAKQEDVFLSMQSRKTCCFQCKAGRRVSFNAKQEDVFLSMQSRKTSFFQWKAGRRVALNFIDKELPHFQFMMPVVSSLSYLPKNRA